MGYSIEKLKSIIVSNGWIPIRYYIKDGLCYYIELLNASSLECCLLYINSDYKFSMDAGGNIFKIKHTDITEGEGEGKGEDSEAVLILSPDKNTTISEYIEGYYDQPIKIKDMSVQDSTEIRTTCKQLIRIKRSVQHLNYKVGIFYKNYICIITKYNEIDVFTVKHFPQSDEKRMVIAFDLKTFYNNSERIPRDIIVVKKGVYNLLEKNQILYTKILDKLAESKQETANIATNAKTKLRMYEEQIKKIESVLPLLNDEEKTLMQKINDAYANTSFDAMSEKASLDTELLQLKRSKEEIINNLSVLRTKRENLLMNVDRVFFENSVMFDKILKNFASLQFQN